VIKPRKSSGGRGETVTLRKLPAEEACISSGLDPDSEDGEAFLKAYGSKKQPTSYALVAISQALQRH